MLKVQHFLDNGFSCSRPGVLELPTSALSFLMVSCTINIMTFMPFYY